MGTERDTPFEVRVHRTAGGVVLTPVGELDALTVPSLAAALDGVAGTDGTVVVDLGETSFIDSKSLALLVRHHHAAKLEGRTFGIARDSGLVRRLLVVTGLHAVLGRIDPATI